MKAPRFVVIVLALAAGWCAGRLSSYHGETVAITQHPAGFQCPMHPWVRSEKPERCTICGMKLAVVGGKVENPDHAALPIVMLPEGSPSVIGVQTAQVEKQRLMRTLRVAGMIGEDESRHGLISAPVEGRIDGLAMNCEGMPVSRRQPIATIFSRTLLGAASDYKLALGQGGPVLEQARRRLEQYGLVWEQISAIPQRQPDDLYFGVLAPLSGTIVKSYVCEGQYVREGDKLFEVADFTRMWFMCTVYEQDLPFVHERQVVMVRTPSLPGETLNARVGFISPNLDETTRSAHVRVVLENPERRLRNKTFAEGVIEIDAPEVLAIPRSAVVWPGETPRVYVEKSTGSYERRKVKLGRTGDALWEVLEGLREGEHVVSSGSLLIDGQAQLDATASMPALTMDRSAKPPVLQTLEPPSGSVRPAPASTPGR